MSARIKPEPVDDPSPMEGVTPSAPLPPSYAAVASSAPDIAGSFPSSSPPPPKKDIQNDEVKEEEDDVVVREIDLYTSPSLTPHLHLLQFPQQPLEPHPLRNSRPPPLPDAARYRPNHAMLELDFPLPTSSFSEQRSVPEALNLQHRTYASESVPVETHMAVGVLDTSGKSMNVVPLSYIEQLRPTFGHVDALYDDGSSDAAALAAEEAKKKAAEGGAGDEKKPLLFKRKESERAELARRTSYAYKRASEEAEEWIGLEVCGPGTLERKAARRAVACPDRDKVLKFLTPGAGGGGVKKETDGGGGDRSRAYVKSLNYLPTAGLDDADDDLEGGWGGGGGGTSEDGEDHRARDAERMRDLAGRIASLLQTRGHPVPYGVLRSKYGTVSDAALIAAVSSSAALVRGNFVVKSSLLGLSPPVADARDLILMLMNRRGHVQRSKLYGLYEDRPPVTNEVLDSILGLVGRKCPNGWEMKVDDDETFVRRFPGEALLHREYWEKKGRRPGFAVRLKQYDEAISKEKVEEERKIRLRKDGEASSANADFEGEEAMS